MVIFFQLHVLHFLNDDKHFIKLHNTLLRGSTFLNLHTLFSRTCHIYSVKVMTHFFTSRKHFFTL